MIQSMIRFLLVCAFAAGAQENYGTWSHYKMITVNTTSTGANVTGGVGKFPLLVRLTPLNADVFSLAAINGADIRFTTADGTSRFPHQRERWDSAAKAAEFWVLLDTVLGNSTTTLRMCWGKNGAGDSSNGGQVFSAANGFQGVWHMGDASGTAARPNAVQGGNAATPVNFPGGYAAKAGVIGLADTLRGGAAGSTSDHLTLGGGYMDYSSGFSYSVWAYPTDANRAYSRLFEAAAGANANGNIELFRNGTTNNLTLEFRNGGTSLGMTTATGVLTVNQWHHYLVTLNGMSTVVYHNGVQAQAGTLTAALAVVARTAYMGRSFFTGDAYYQGVLDESQLSNVVRSANWAKLSYETQKSGATAVTLGATQPPVSIATRKAALKKLLDDGTAPIDVKGRKISQLHPTGRARAVVLKTP